MYYIECKKCRVMSDINDVIKNDMKCTACGNMVSNSDLCFKQASSTSSGRVYVPVSIVVEELNNDVQG